MVGRDAEPFREIGEQGARLFRRGGEVGRLGGDQRGIAPDRLAVLAPVEREGPARQAFARIPFALAVMQESTRREAGAQPADQLVGAAPLGRADGFRVPFRRLVVVDRDEGRFAAHGEAHVLAREVGIDLLAERVERRPALVGEGERHAGILRHPVDAHVEFERCLGAGIGRKRAGDRRGRAKMRSGAERQVALASEQARGRVHADPAGAGNIDLGPGVQVGEVDRRAGGAVERDDVGLQLDQVSGDEARGEAEMAQDLHQEPAGIAARAGARGERLLRRLHAGLHADQVADVVLQALVQPDQEGDDLG